jgi:hypothetical protein
MMMMMMMMMMIIIIKQRKVDVMFSKINETNRLY